MWWLWQIMKKKDNNGALHIHRMHREITEKPSNLNEIEWKKFVKKRWIKSSLVGKRKKYHYGLQRFLHYFYFLHWISLFHLMVLLCQRCYCLDTLIFIIIAIIFIWNESHFLVLLLLLGWNHNPWRYLNLLRLSASLY